MARVLVLQGHWAKLRIICVREHQKSLADSAKPAIEHWIDHYRLRRHYLITEDEINHVNGTKITFHGASKSSEEDIKGWEGAERCWFEEAHRMSVRSRELIYPTVFRRATSEMLLTFNPFQRTDPVYKDFVSGDFFHHDRYVRKVIYSDNAYFPPLEEKLRAEFERTQPDRYPHIWLGEPDDGDADTQVLTYGVLRECIEAYERGYAPTAQEVPLVDVGLDLAYGGKDKCALVIRRGPIIEKIDRWPGRAGYLTPAIARAHHHVLPYQPYTVYYDAGGGDSVKGEFERLGADYQKVPIGFGGEVKGKLMNYEPRYTNEQTFRARNIQMAYALRLRANRTVKLLRGVEGIDPLRCLFIRPDLPELEDFMSELCRPKKRISPLNGKIELDKRGGDEAAKSPDYFDATCLAFARDSESGLRSYD